MKISSRAVSSIVNQLIPTGMIERVPAPGSRRDHYRFRKHAWANLTGNQNILLDSMQNAAAEGSKAPGHDSIAGRRLDEMQDFYSFMQHEMAALIDKWRQRCNASDH
ncbi:hypothetical protein GCM10010510_17410 [Streptomyces anandii JCM 4720]|nr:hypothetical protein GCM10010510_17410 [Streptomyces anandii JCM 4720]